MEIPEKIGWKRLLLTRSQKYLLDISRLGSDKEPDKVEKIIIFLEGWTPSMFVFRAKKYGFKALLRVYWTVIPVRLHVVSARKPWIQESLPWFPDGEYDRYITVNNWNRKQLKIDSLRRDINSKKKYVYSWKKAYLLINKVAEEVHQRELQSTLDWKLKREKRLKNDSTQDNS